MTFLVFLVVLLAAALHAVWNFAAKRAAGNLGALWLGGCLGAVLSWPCAVLAHQMEPLTLIGLPYIGATGILHAWYFGLLARSYVVGDISLVYPVARGTGVAGTATVASVFLHERLSLAGVAGILAICLGTGLLGWSKEPLAVRQRHRHCGHHAWPGAGESGVADSCCSYGTGCFIAMRLKRRA